MKEELRNKKIFNESIRIGHVSVDDSVIWTSDEVINGLYTINKTNYEVENILDSFQIFKYGKFLIISIFSWNNNIILLPSELNKRWVFYNKESKKLRFKNIVHLNCRTAGIYIIEKKGVLIPASTKDPVIILSLETFSIVQIINDWYKDITKNQKEVFETRTGVVLNKNLYFFIHKKNYLFRIGESGIKQYEVKISGGISSLGGWKNGLWVLPERGNSIFQINEQGDIVEIADLVSTKKIFSVDKFVRIIDTERYVFLLPISIQEIGVYDKQAKIMCSIDTRENALKNILPISRYTTAYWEYFIENGKLYLLPLEHKLLEIDLSTLQCRHKDIYLPSLISGQGLMYWFEQNQLIGNVDNKELNKYSLGLYLERVKKYSDNKCGTNDKKNGIKIWGKAKL